MKNIRQIVSEAVAVVTALLIITVGGAKRAGADVIGGYINTHDKEFAIVFDAINTQKLLLGASLESLKIGGGAEKTRGQLYIVYPNGRWVEAAKAYRDKAGVNVSVPVDKFDKIIYVDSRMYVRGGIGLSEQEITKIAYTYKSADAVKASKFVAVEKQKEIFEAVELAAGATKEAYKMDDDERRDIFTSTVGFTGGMDAQKIVGGLLKTADVDDVAPFTGIADVLFGESKDVLVNNLILGVGLVSEGDNGGGVGSVSEGDNGGGVGSVSEGDNGGGIGNVSEGDNGGGVGNVSEGDNGGGVGAVVQGWAGSSHSLQVPFAVGLAANCAGTVVFMF